MDIARLLVSRYVHEFGRRRGNAAKPARWTLARVGGLIEDWFGVSYSVVHVRNILTSLVGDDQRVLSKARFWACLIELAYPQYKGKSIVDDFDGGREVSIKIIWELRERLRS